MRDKHRPIELLAPARDAATGIAAITHGADAVYIGPELFGARASAANSTDDIKRLAEFAHQFRAKVYATVNTIIADRDLPKAEKLITALYKAGTDALIVQDMGILRLDIPPIELHASTQCDTRTPEKARFLQEAGFSQIVLARELTLEQIKAVYEAVDVPVECFIHGALCVSYSGRCQASYATCGRSANQGNCAQLCRLSYTLADRNGKHLVNNAHLLSLKDFNATDLLPQLLAAGASSLKIEGRLKNELYVKNVTAWYRSRLDEIIASNPTLYTRSSCGKSTYNFTPDPQKSFNRGFTTYFLTGPRPQSITSPRTPKSLGEPVTPATEIHAGDGLSFFDRKGEYVGVRVNKVSGGRIIPARPVQFPRTGDLYRTLDFEFEKALSRTDSGIRTIGVKIDLYVNRAEATDERDCRAVVAFNGTVEQARKPMDYRNVFEKLGDSIYRLTEFNQHFKTDTFIPRSELTALRRALIEALDRNARISLPRGIRCSENKDFPYPEQTLLSSDNVYNHLAYAFYRSHGVTQITPAIEQTFKKSAGKQPIVVMQTRHCILRELGKCKKSGFHPAEPLSISNRGGAAFQLEFDCRKCEMKVILA